MRGRALVVALTTLALLLPMAAPAAAYNVGSDESPDGGATTATAGDRTEVTYTYRVTSRGEVASDLDAFAAAAGRILDDQRGWTLGGAVAFEPVSSGGDLTLILASPQEVDAAHEVCDPQYSCRVEDEVYINDDNWRNATSAWRGAGGDLATYRQYLINHEVGHFLGFDHTGCPGSGRRAPVMQQQSISLDGCEPAGWPTSAERDTLGDRLDVPVRDPRQEPRLMGDFTGDGQQDVAEFDVATGQWRVGVSTTDAYDMSVWSRFRTRRGWQVHRAGDLNGDGVDEIASFHAGTGNWVVQSSEGSSFDHRVWATYSAPAGWRIHHVGDVTGDGTDELVSLHGGTGNWVVTRLADGGAASSVWETYRTTTGWESFLADVDGDGRADLANHHPGTGNWMVSRSAGTDFATSRWATYRSSGWQTHEVADATGDGRADVLSYHPGTGNVVLGRSTGQAFSPSVWTSFSTRRGWATHRAADVTGDGRAEWLSLHGPTGRWIVTRAVDDGVRSSIAGVLPTADGWAWHATAEVTGDDRADITSFHANAGTWWVARSLGDDVEVTRWAER